MIKSITMKNIASYNDVGITINNLEKINFFYGANATGKTTISNFLGNQDQLIYKDCSVVWENNNKLPCYVYNKKFCELNYTEKIKGIFTLGQATVEQREVINRKTDDLKSIKEKGIQTAKTIESQNNKINELIKNFREDAWNKIFKRNEPEFSSAFEGFKNSKDKFKDKLLDEFQNNKSELKTKDELIDKAKTIFGNSPIPLVELSLIPYNELLEIENNILWEKKIIGKDDVDIAKLINRLNIGDWVHQGKKYIEADSDVCPFCQKHTIDDNFKKQISDYFDETFVDSINSINNLKNKYSVLSATIINRLHEIETKVKSNEDYPLNIEIFSSIIFSFSNQVSNNNQTIANKNKEPSRSFHLISTKESLDTICNIVSEANEKIRTHNALVKNYPAEREKLIKEVWKYVIEDNKNVITSFIKQSNGLQKGLDELNKKRRDLLSQYNSLYIEIKELNKNVTSVQPSIDNINKTLKSYGFLNFKIVPSTDDPNQYQIQREDGSIANYTLSEGEKTFITFLYYLQLVHGSTTPETVNEKRILVIDDPISSLDSNILFVVSSLLKEIIKDIQKGKGNVEQIILLTHNVYFHKEVSYVDGRKQEKKENCPYFWILRKNGNYTNIYFHEDNNPIQNSYELLWQEIRDCKNLSIISVQNTLRKILENYFKILGGFSDDNIISKFNTHEEQEICRSLLCWINDGSHCIPDDLYVEQQDGVIQQYLQVFRRIFENTHNIGHYNMMMKISGE